MVERSRMSRTREQYLRHLFSNKDSRNFRPKYLAPHWYLLPTPLRHEGSRRSTVLGIRAPEHGLVRRNIAISEVHLQRRN